MDPLPQDWKLSLHSFCSKGRLCLLWLSLLVAGPGGCASLANPVANGVPVHILPQELLGESKANLETIPLTSLRQKPPAEYLLGPGDILGVWVEGILGEKGQAPPTKLAELGTQAAIGFPIPVRDDGTISLPLIDPVAINGLTIKQVQEAIKKAYSVDKQIIQPGRERIIVTLQQPRQHHILVIRQDSASSDIGGGGGGTGGGRATGFVIGIGSGSRGARRGTGFSIGLPAYENDVLNALARTGGFPGSDAANEIIIERGSFRGDQDRDEIVKNLEGKNVTVPRGQKTIRIPLKIKPGEPLGFQPEDILLQSGDIVFIESREADVFYTGGLLPPGEYILPRDVDLDVVEAISRIGGILNSGGINALNINGNVLNQGLGFPSPCLITVLRRTPNGGQVPINVDLNRALRDPRERILIQPKDVVLLQERPQDAITRYITNTLHFTFFYRFVDSARSRVTGEGIIP